MPGFVRKSPVLSADGTMLAIGYSAMNGIGRFVWTTQYAAVYETYTGKRLRILRGAETPIAFSDDGRLLSAAGVGEKGEIWEVKRGRRVHRFYAGSGLTAGTSFSADGAWLAVSKWGEGAWVVLVEKGENPLTLVHPTPAGQSTPAEIARRNENSVSAAKFSPNGHLCALGRTWGIDLVEVPANRKLATLRFSTGINGVGAIEFTPDGNMIIAAGKDSVVAWVISETEGPS
jgi:WD40 repeat protein